MIDCWAHTQVDHLQAAHLHADKCGGPIYAITGEGIATSWWKADSGKRSRPHFNGFILCDRIVITARGNWLWIMRSNLKPCVCNVKFVVVTHFGAFVELLVSEKPPKLTLKIWDFEKFKWNPICIIIFHRDPFIHSFRRCVGCALASSIH